MYKTIVVHVSPGPGAANTHSVAAGLANAMSAHLVGATVSGVIELNYLIAGGAPLMMMPAIEADVLRTDAEQRLTAFAQFCSAQGVASCETRLLDTTAAEGMLLQSRYCDLLVAGRDDVAEHGLLMPARLPGYLVTQSTRPVLLVPPTGKFDGKFGTVMVAWNGSPGASRAIAFALPLLRRAGKVLVTVCNADLERVDMGAEPGADLATYLSRHNANVEVVQADTNEETGSALCALARERHADLIVAGAFGHSRLHDWVLGGTTASLIDQAPVPLLMSH